MAEQCVALCDYEGIEGELTLNKGDRITVIAKGGDAGFWEGVVDAGTSRERQGFFPSCMVTSNMNPERAPVFLDKAMALYDYVPKDDLEMALTKGDVITVLRQHPSSPGWWMGYNETGLIRDGKQSTIAPAYVAGSGNKRDPIPVERDEKDAKIFPSNFVTSKLVMALFPFQGRHSHELSFQVKDVILVHRRWNDGWWEGTLKGKRGIFPSNYTAPNVSTLQPPFFCTRCKTVYAPSSWECKECARNEEITKSMLQALEDHSNGVGSSTTEDAQCDLFAYVDVDPKHGKGSLLTITDTLDKQTIGPKG